MKKINRNFSLISFLKRELKNNKKCCSYPLLKGIIRESNKAFSLIELIVVISIIAIISSSGMFYYNNFVEKLKISNSVSEIKSDLDSLDNKISKREIFDYELYFEKDKPYYLNFENVFDLDVSLQFNSLDLNSWIWVISFSWANSWTWSIKYYENYKFKKQEEIDYNWTFTWSFLEYQNYKILWSFSGQILNNINLNYFDRNKFIRLVNINNWTSDLNSVKIKNILWKKVFWNNESINKIILTFEDNIWRRENLEIIK